MRLIILVILICYSSLVLSFAEDSGTIKINRIYCKYSIEIPVGWDTIRTDTLINRFGKGIFDAGLYNSETKAYFNNSYIQYLFIPTIKPLNQLTFNQITKEVRNSINLSNRYSQDPKISLTVNNFKADPENHLFIISGKVASGIKERRYAQIILVTKFGYLEIMSYEALFGESKSLANKELFATVKVENGFQYIEKPYGFKLNKWHFLLSVFLGFIVFIIIQFYPKIKMKFTKEELT